MSPGAFALTDKLLFISTYQYLLELYQKLRKLKEFLLFIRLETRMSLKIIDQSQFL